MDPKQSVKKGLYCIKLVYIILQCKQTIDKFHLQLQNLLYEVMHLEKEITKCLEFK